MAFDLRRSWRLSLLLPVLLGTPPFLRATNGAPYAQLELPEGTLESRRVWLEAPEAACLSYLQASASRVWTIGLPDRGSFLGALFGLDLSETTRRALAEPALWSETPDGSLLVRPPPELLRRLAPAERSSLYGLLAQWMGNRPERWPLVLPAREPWAGLRRAGIPAEVIDAIERLCYPFAGGWALSDFSVIAADFPDEALLLRVLTEISTVEASIPRLRIRTAARVSDVLAYWTVNHRNPFAHPLLEALLETGVEDGVELSSLLPGSARLLSFSVDPAEVPLDTSLRSLVLSASLASFPRSVTNPREFHAWFARAFRPVAPPYRYGDVLLIDYPGEPRMQYACAFVAGEVVFARDPVGLGLWRFLTLEELLTRNPHFAGARFRGHRVVPPAP